MAEVANISSRALLYYLRARAHGGRLRAFSCMGAFVYQRSNKVRAEADDCEKRCKRHSCDLQACIATLPVEAGTSRLPIERCDVFLQKYNTCCEAVKAAAAPSSQQADRG
jgi:hypothetical protein